MIETKPTRPMTGRARRRATSSAGAAQHVQTQAPAVTTVSAAEAAADTSATTGASVAPSAPAVAPESDKPKRKKRARVVSPAGPPAAETD